MSKTYLLLLHSQFLGSCIFLGVPRESVLGGIRIGRADGCRCTNRSLFVLTYACDWHALFSSEGPEDGLQELHLPPTWTRKGWEMNISFLAWSNYLIQHPMRRCLPRAKCNIQNGEKKEAPHEITTSCYVAWAAWGGWEGVGSQDHTGRRVQLLGRYLISPWAEKSIPSQSHAILQFLTSGSFHLLKWKW